MKRPRSSVELYEVMRSAIAYFRAHAPRRPAAAEVARAVGMSPSRFEHAFAEWVGTTPKRFLAHLTKERAKVQLAASKDVLRAAHASGLSGPGRLHALLVTHDAVSPGEYKSGKIDIAYGLQPSPFGWCLIALTKRGICKLSFIDTQDDRAALASIRETWPRARIVRDDARAAPFVKRIFAARRGARPIPVVLKGTNFQTKVWEALLAIPEGALARYADVARAVGSPKATRAVGSACGKNPIGFLIPCHRVLAADGGAGGYHWGVDRKEAMLAWEASRQAS